MAGTIIAPGVGTAAGATIGGALGGMGDASEASDDADDALAAQKDAAFAKKFTPLTASEPPSSSPIQVGQYGSGGGGAPYSDDILDELERKYGRKGAA